MKILVINADSGWRGEVRSKLGEEYSVVGATNASDALATIEMNEDVKVVLSSLRLRPDSNLIEEISEQEALNFLQCVRGRYPKLPIAVISDWPLGENQVERLNDLDIKEYTTRDSVRSGNAENLRHWVRATAEGWGR